MESGFSNPLLLESRTGESALLDKRASPPPLSPYPMGCSKIGIPRGTLSTREGESLRGVLTERKQVEAISLPEKRSLLAGYQHQLAFLHFHVVKRPAALRVVATGIFNRLRRAAVGVVIRVDVNGGVVIVLHRLAQVNV